MALIHCPECSSEVSSEAFKCPKCGKTLRKPTRTFFGKIIKWGFILFNLLMIIWLISGMHAASNVVQSAATEAERTGAEVGAGIGAMMIITVWAIGDLILGIFVFLTHPKS
jgi:anti-sigma factor RsiW